MAIIFHLTLQQYEMSILLLSGYGNTFNVVYTMILYFDIKKTA